MTMNGTQTIEKRVDKLEESSALHDYAMGKVAAFDAHLQRYEKKLDGFGEDLRDIKKALGVVQQRGSRAEETVDEIARAAVGIQKTRWALAVKVALAVIAVAASVATGWAAGHRTTTEPIPRAPNAAPMP